MKTSAILCDLSIEILQKTNDGKELDPADLWLVENAINGFLTDKGVEKFNDLHSCVINGTYDRWKNYLLGIQYLTKDHDGYVYFKGRVVEHYSFRDADREERTARRLQKICLKLEEKGIAPSISTAIVEVEKYLSQEELKLCDE